MKVSSRGIERRGMWCVTRMNVDVDVLLCCLAIRVWLSVAQSRRQMPDS